MVPIYITVSSTDFTIVGTSNESPTLPVAKDVWLHKQKKVQWLLEQKELREVLFEGYTGDLNIVYVDRVWAYGDRQTLSFSLYGGSKCSPTMPCVVSLKQVASHFAVTITRLKVKLLATTLWST